MRFLFFSFVILLSSTQLFSQSQSSKTLYQNPVIAGDVPDPSVIRVGPNYYAAATTSDFAPNYPVYESVDLINWKRIGYIFNNCPDWASGSFWAPELYYHNGTYFVYYTAKRKKDNVSCIGVATTKDLRKGFEDHGIIIEWGKEAIDAFVFKDDDGKLYISWKAYGLNKDRPIEILASELSADGLSLVGEHFSLTRYDKGWTGAGDEGQCLVKHNNYYYLLYSIGGCCDNKCSYQVMVARSENLKSGWEQYAQNPILQSGDVWKCPGHGTLVETPDQRFFYLYHAYNATDFEFIGRQGMLDELLWNKETGWPNFKNGKTPSVKAEVPFSLTVQNIDSIYSADFSSFSGLKLWQWDLKRSKPRFQTLNNSLLLTSTDSLGAFLGISPEKGNYTMETSVSLQDNAIKGICIYGNMNNTLSLVVSKSYIKVLSTEKGITRTITENALPASKKVFLRVESIGGSAFRFSWSLNQKEWFVCKDNAANEKINGTYLPQWGVAMRAGLIVLGTNRQAEFSLFKMTYSNLN